MTRDAPYRSPERPPEARLAACFFCGGPGIPGSQCTSCMIRIPEPTTPDMPLRSGCVRCGAFLAATPIDATGVIVHACGSCRSVFVPPRAWCLLVASPDVAAAFEEQQRAAPVPASALVSLLHCPVCARQMERGRFGAASTIVVDVCEAHGVWLDAGELGAIVRHAAQRAAGGAEEAERQRLTQRYLADELTRHYAKRPTPPLTHAKRAGGAIALVLLLVRLLMMGHAQRHPAAATGGVPAAAERASSKL